MKKKILSIILMLALVLNTIVPQPVFAEGTTQKTDVIQENSRNSYIGDGYEVSFIIVSQWEDGFNAEVAITNTGKEDIENWALQFNFPYEITNIWNGAVYSHEESTYIIKNTGYNQRISKGESVRFGFIANAVEPVTTPDSYDLAIKKTCVNANNLDYSFELTNVSGASFQGEIKIKNLSENTIEGWTLEFDFEGKIERFWEAEILEHNGDHYIIRNMGYNYQIDAHKTLTIGFEGTLQNRNVSPFHYNLTQVVVCDTKYVMLEDGKIEKDYLAVIQKLLVQQGLPINNIKLSDDYDGDGILDGDAIVTQYIDFSIKNSSLEKESTIPYLTITGKGDFSEQIRLETIKNNEMFSEMNCLLGSPYEFVHENNIEFNSCTLSFSINNEVLADISLNDLAIAWFDYANNSLELLDTTIDPEKNLISANVTHFSTYVIVNKKTYYQTVSYSDLLGMKNVYLNENYNTQIQEFNGKYYSIIDDFQVTGLTWGEARTFCNNLGGHLAVITDDKEQNFIMNQLLPYGKKKSYWLGATDIQREGIWKWVTDEPFEYSAWQKGEPNNGFRGTEHFLGIYNTVKSNATVGRWNDFTVTGSSEGIANIGVICEWEQNLTNKVRLSNGTIVELEKDPNLEDMEIDSDKDGIPDLEELKEKKTITFYNPVTKEEESYEVWTFDSNPAMKDTDGDGLMDDEDLSPAIFDTAIVEQNDSMIKFNTGNVWNIITCTSYDYWDNLCEFIDNSVKNHIPKDEFKEILIKSGSNIEQDFNIDELTIIGLLNNEGSKLYMNSKSQQIRETVFHNLTDRESKYYQHTGLFLWNNWKEVDKNTKVGFFRGRILSEADLNFSDALYFGTDIYGVIEFLASIGAVMIVEIVGTIATLEATPIIAANIDGIIYYCKTFCIIQGIRMYQYLGIHNLPNGIMSIVEMDLADGDSTAEDILAYADNVVYADEDIWLEPAVIRGNKADVLLGNNLCHNFPVIDKLEGTTITSIKSIDLSLKTYQTKDRLYNVLVRYISKLNGFTRMRWNGIEIETADYTTKVLQVAVPNHNFTLAQKLAFESAKAYGNEKNIELIVTVISTH